MIPQAYINHWRAFAPWQSDVQIEQDLILSRMLGIIFADDYLRAELAFRGGTALHKLFCPPAVRYSEDIDLVQISAGPIGPLVDRLRDLLQPVFGVPQYKHGGHGYTFFFRYAPEDTVVAKARVKIEINGREHDTVFGLHDVPYNIDSPWFQAQSTITTYRIEELLGTKLRALFQRRKGRDLFDLYYAAQVHTLDFDAVIIAFQHAIDFQGVTVSREDFISNLDQKMLHAGFRSDMDLLLRPEVEYDIDEAYRFVVNNLIAKMQVRS